MPERVQKVLAAAGVGSRRACEELIAEGRVTVDGRVVALGAKADPDHSVIAVDGERVPVRRDLVHLLLNKPRGVVTTANDPEGRTTVTDLVPPSPRVYPVGRLDRDTEGLLVLTNDGELANRLAHPRYEVEKTYVAQVKGPVRRRTLRALREGVELDDGPAAARSVRELGSSGERVLLELTLTEGRKREVRRLLSAVGHPVQRLARVRIGPLSLGEISPGKHRPLNTAEVRGLYRAVGLGPTDETDVDEPSEDAEGDEGIGAPGESVAANNDDASGDAGEATGGRAGTASEGAAQQREGEHG